MAIESKKRGGERNEFERSNAQNLSVTDLSEHLNKHFLDKLKEALPEEVEFFFNKSTALSFEHEDGTKAAYLINFFPLDVTLTSDEVGGILKVISFEDTGYLPEIVSEILEEHINNILEEVERVKSYHPYSKLTIAFAPADTVSSVNTAALPVYGFLFTDGESFKFESESSFVVIPNDEMSRAYIGYQLIAREAI